MSLVVAKQIYKNYGKLEVLKGVDLSIDAGEAFAIIGPNGAGKTTLFKVLTGETRDFTGSVVMDGHDVTRQPVHQRARGGVGRTFQVARVFGEMSILTNVILAIESSKVARGEPVGPWWDWRPSAATRREAIGVLESVGLGRNFDDEASLLSHGDKKRLEFATMLAGRPRILMLDEPTAGMSAEDRRSTTRLLQDLKSRGLTIVLTEHDMGVVFGLADRVMVLNYGQIVCVGDPQTVREDEAVKRVYLGKGAGHA
ncbi:ABC transporter ATP-binding protein [Mesorhizobium sp. IMUNJ 23232]|uniref:ABC transporter ATP-binding protein n=1 Tax=Mesorhizobium sp. IMUNJ 23232 TaxID=3376064 RepID=UPI003790952A